MITVYGEIMKCFIILFILSSAWAGNYGAKGLDTHEEEIPKEAIKQGQSYWKELKNLCRKTKNYTQATLNATASAPYVLLMNAKEKLKPQDFILLLANYVQQCADEAEDPSIDGFAKDFAQKIMEDTLLILPIVAEQVYQSTLLDKKELQTLLDDKEG